MKSAPSTISQLSKRAQKLLADNGIKTLNELCSKSWLEIHRLPGCGFKTGLELDEFIRSNGLIYRTDRPKDDLADFYMMLKVEHETTSDFREMGDAYGVNADIMYQIYSGVERAARMYEKTLAAHLQWRDQLGK